MQMQPPLAATNVFFQEIQFGICIHVTKSGHGNPKIFGYASRASG